MTRFIGKYVGQNQKRIDAYEKVTGKALYATDVAVQTRDAVHMHALVSPYAHAKITKLDLSKAEKAPGVVGIITGEEPGIDWESFPKDAIMAQNNEVIWAGQIVALVAAETLEQAKDAIELIDIEYEVLPHVLYYWDAIKPDPVSVVDPMWGKRDVVTDRPMDEIDERVSPNVVGAYKLDTGNVDEAMKTADIIIEKEFYTGKKTASQMETPLCTCIYEPNGKIILSSNGMGVHGVVKMGLSKMLGIKENMLRVVSPHSGGSFGSRLAPIMEVLCIMMARKIKRTVIYRLTREQQFTTAPSNWPGISKIKMGAKKDGTIVALDWYVAEECGAAINNSYFTGRMCASGANMCYDFGEARIDSCAVTTNTVPAAEYRGLGVPESEFAIECVISEIADQLGIDQLDMRLKNLLRKGDKNCVGEAITSTGLEDCLKSVYQSVKVDEPSIQDGSVWKRGKGIASAGKQNTPLGRSEATVLWNSDATVTLLLSNDENGMGATTALKQIAAEVLKMPIENIEVIRADTDATPYDNYGASSRTTYTTGNAVRIAAMDCIQKLRDEVGRAIGVHPINVEIEGTKAIVHGYQVPEIEIDTLFKPINFFEQGNFGLMKGTPVRGHGVYCPAPVLQWGADGRCARQWNWYQYSACAAEVEVNEETGEVRVIKFASAADTGNPINPKLVEGQIEGGVHMAIGFSIMEDHFYDKNGMIANRNLGDYRIPTIMEMPKNENVASIICPDALPDGPFGAKGMAESITVPVAPAIAEAVYNAVGIRVDSYPMTAEKVLKLIKEKKEAAN